MYHPRQKLVLSQRTYQADLSTSLEEVLVALMPSYANTECDPRPVPVTTARPIRHLASRDPGPQFKRRPSARL
jgi:hypothetical protein